METNHPRFFYVAPSATYIAIGDPLDRVAFVAHNCYQVALKSHAENVSFVSQLVTNRHLAMAEHAVFTIATSPFFLDELRRFANPFIRFDLDGDRLLVSYSLRVVIEHACDPEPAARKVVSALALALPPECQALVPHIVGMASPFAARLLTPAELLKLPAAVRDRHLFVGYTLITDRGVTHELVRHRVCSFAQESTRYCNYTRKRFGEQIAIIKPLDYQSRPELYDAAFGQAAASYFALIAAGALPQQARTVLPTGLKANLAVSAFMDEWRHIFALRLAPDAHPEARRVLRLAECDMEKRGLLEPDSYRGQNSDEWY